MVLQVFSELCIARVPAVGLVCWHPISSNITQQVGVMHQEMRLGVLVTELTNPRTRTASNAGEEGGGDRR